LSILYSLGSKPLQIWDAQGRSNSTWDFQVCECGILSAILRICESWGQSPEPSTTTLFLELGSLYAVIEYPHIDSVLSVVRNGHIKRITDEDISSSVLEIVSANVSTTYVTCPADPAKTLGIKLPFLVMIIKNLKRYFSFEVQVLDDKNVRRRFRASNYQVPCLPA